MGRRLRDRERSAPARSDYGSTSRGYSEGSGARSPPPARVEPTRVEPARRTTIVVPQREILVIERVQRPHGWWRHPGYRMVTVYYDGGRFYRRPFDRRPLRKVFVYVRAGRYYVDEVQWRRDHRRHYGRDYDGWKDDDKDGSKGNNGHHLGRDHDKDKD